MVTEVELKRMWWHSRRGMLELDLLLVPFAEGKLKVIDESKQLLYELLLKEEDQDLFTWLIEKEVAPKAELREIVEIILDR